MPLALPKVYSYAIDDELYRNLSFGCRVEVPLRNKLYSGIYIEDRKEAPNSLAKLRKVVTVIDQVPIIIPYQFKLWSWIASYYMCTIGEVMNIALPTGLKLSSETKLIFNTEIDPYQEELSDKEFLLAEAISIQNELTINQVQDILDQKTVYPFIKSLLEKNILYVKEELKHKFKPKIEDFIELKPPYNHADDSMHQALDLTKKSEKQTRALLAFVQLAKQTKLVSKKALYEQAEIDSSVIKALTKKEIFNIVPKEVSRISSLPVDQLDLPPLNPHQVRAKEEIHNTFLTKDIALLFGVTGSGKTRIYIDLIKETIKEGKQVLYLLPEIALTTQIVSRLLGLFSEEIGVYHSRMSNNQRVELWQAVMEGKALTLGARSSIFLPFKNLGLIIVDEEHDPSFKQTDPSPRYNARDTAIYLARMYKAKVLLGTATPALETYLNASTGKYGLIKLLERHGESILPKIEIIDLRKQYKSKLMQAMFSKDLKDAIDQALEKKEQVLIFQNRRGYAPTLQCKVCDFNAQCPNCDVSLTVHKFYNELRCHYCGYHHKTPSSCPSCGFAHLERMGFGTEKIEAEVKKIFPQAIVRRMDYDTAKTKKAFEVILEKFRDRKIDILVGTQMITKGLDFDNISIVGVLAADKILHFPDYKANERAFQLFTQVAGRAGRRAKQGRVMIQTFNPLHPVIVETQMYKYGQFYIRELSERKKFIYPPYYRMIRITLKHKVFKQVEAGAQIMFNQLSKVLGNRVFGPTTPGISRIRGMYIQLITIKMEKRKEAVLKVKQHIENTKNNLLEMEGKKSLRINIDVDP